MMKSRLLKAEMVALICVVAVWAINLKTGFVSRTRATIRERVRGIGVSNQRDLGTPLRRLVGHWQSDDGKCELYYEMSVRTDEKGNFIGNDPECGTVSQTGDGCEPTKRNFQILWETPSADTVALAESRLAYDKSGLKEVGMAIRIPKDGQSMTREYTIDGHRYRETYRYVGFIERPWPTNYWADTTLNEKTTNTPNEQTTDTPKDRTSDGHTEAPNVPTFDEELVSVNSYIAQRRQNIENWYTENLANLKRWAEQRNRELDQAEKTAWAWCQQQLQNTESDTEGRISVDSYGRTNTYSYSPRYATTTGYDRTDGRFSETTQNRVVGNPTAEYQGTLERIRQERWAIEQKFTALKEEKERDLDDLEMEGNRRRSFIEFKKRRARNQTKKRHYAGPGRLDGIFVSDNGRYCEMIEGVIVHEGDYYNGHKVQEIRQYSVEFEKAGKVIVQNLY